jgi:alpha-tubulin suppressor-like RCC1 family protein
MALNFPSSASVGQTYSSGSSAVYQWDGYVWDILNVTASANFVPATASYAPVVRKNITYVSPVGYSSYIMYIADGKLYMSKGNDSTQNVTALSTLNPSGSSDAVRGISNAFEVTFPNETGSIASASLQGSSAYVLFDNGNLYSWGDNYSGQLGLGDTTDRYTPTLTSTNVAHLYWHQTCQDDNPQQVGVYIRKTDGFVYHTGYTGAYNVGNGTNSNMTSWTKIDAIGQNPLFVARFGNNSGGSIVQKADGTVIVAGRNNYNFLGISNSSTTLTNWTTSSGWLNGTSSLRIDSVYGGAQHFDGGGASVISHMVALLTGSGATKKLMSCGASYFGCTATGNSTDVNTPVTCSLPFNHNLISKVSGKGGNATVYHVLTTSGSVYTWGYGTYGALGDGGTAVSNYTPKLVLTGAVDMIDTFNNKHVWGYVVQSPIFKKTDGTYVNTGGSQYAGLGNGSTTTVNAISLSSSLAVMNFPYSSSIKFTGMTTIQNDGTVRYVVTTDNRVYAWGYNGDYVIYPSSQNNVASPVEVTPWIFVN